jgi:acyl carrier protein
MTEDLSELSSFIRYAENELQVKPLSADTEFRKISSWSSLNALLFISGINERTDVLISSADLAACKTLGDIHRLILNRSRGAFEG